MAGSPPGSRRSRHLPFAPDRNRVGSISGGLLVPQLQAALESSIRSGVCLDVQDVHGHPEFFQPFTIRWPRETPSGSLTASPSMPSMMVYTFANPASGPSCFAVGRRPRARLAWDAGAPAPKGAHRTDQTVTCAPLSSCPATHRWRAPCDTTTPIVRSDFNFFRR
jgi:hypothetical protein